MSKPQGTFQDNNIQIIRWEKPDPISQEEAEARLSQEGYETYRWHDVSGASYPRHRHGFDECLWILKGQFQLTIGEQTYHLKAGDRIYLPATTVHSSFVADPNGVTYLVGRKN